MRCGRALVAALCAMMFSAGAARAATLSDSVYVREHYRKRELLIPMRDGTHLFTAVYVPRDAATDRRYPILLLRTPFGVAPYGPDAYPERLGPNGFTVRDGYIVVMQDVRGRYRSEGLFENVRPLLADSVKQRNARATDEATDTYDTIDWLLANVPHHNGRVGQWGISYAGFYALQGLRSGHPALVASSPQAPVTDFFFEDFHHHGALLQGHFYAYPVFGVPRGAPTEKHWWLPEFLSVSAYGQGDDYASQLAIGPLRQVTERFYSSNTLWRDIVEHPNYDAFWQARAVAPTLRGIRASVLIMGGWFDAENLYGTLAAYSALRRYSPQAHTSLVVGPFAHRGWAAPDVAHTTHGDLYFGDSLATRLQRDVEASFFRRTLKEQSSAVVRTTATARLFDTGSRQWREWPVWPTPSARQQSWYFQANGTLSRTLPALTAGRVNSSLEYVSDPQQPVPSRCRGRTIEDGALDHVMSDDQRCFVNRRDVLTFQTAPLERDLTVGGEITAELRVSITGTDADFVVKVIDVYPPGTPDHPYRADSTVHLAGYHQLVRGEIMRGRFRDSFSAPVPFRSGEPSSVTIRLPDVLHTFKAGHRLMVQVQSSWFPLFDRNPQTFVPNIYLATASDFVTSTHRLHLAPGAASRLRLPVIPTAQRAR